MPISAALGATVGLIPIALGAGVLMKVTERMLPTQGRTPRRQGRPSRRPRRDAFDVGFGNFSNLRVR